MNVSAYMLKSLYDTDALYINRTTIIVIKKVKQFLKLMLEYLEALIDTHQNFNAYCMFFMNVSAYKLKLMFMETKKIFKKYINSIKHKERLNTDEILKINFNINWMKLTQIICFTVM